MAEQPSAESHRTSCGTTWWSWMRPTPWAALVWVPLMVAGPAAALGTDLLGWLGLTVVVAAAVAAVCTAVGRTARGALPDLLLGVQAVASLLTALTLPPDVSLWLWVLLGLTVGAALRPRWTLWGIAGVALVAAVWLGRDSGWGGAVGGAFTVAASGLGTAAFYRLLDTVAELRRTRAQLAATAVLEERERISRDLHDLLGHSLSVIVVKAEAVRRIGPRDPDAVAAHAHDIETIGRAALKEVRQAVSGYRGNGLADELARAEESLRAAGIRATLRSPDPMPPAVAADVTLGWVVREAATNVLRHAHATECVVMLSVDAGEAELTIADDGVGWSGRSDDNGSSGMRGLTERLRGAGGTLRVDGEPGRGTQVTARIPLPTAPARPTMAQERAAP